MVTLIHRISEVAKQDPERVALLDTEGRVVTFAEFLEQVSAFGFALRELGVTPASRVGLLGFQGLQIPLVILATMSCAVAAPLNPALREADLRRERENLELDFLITPPALTVHKTAASEIPLPSAQQGALVLTTSGTTGQPKPVLLTHTNLSAAVGAIARVLELTESDRCLGLLPLFHIHGLSALLATLCSGGSFLETGGLDEEQFPRWLSTLGPTWTTAAPVHYHRIARLGRSAEKHSLRFLRSASDAMPVSLIHCLEQLYQVPFIEAYGMTEAAPLIASTPLPPGTRKPGSVGMPVGVELEIRNDQGQTLAVGMEGEIVVRGPNVAVDGWLLTGDLGRFDSDGYLYLTGRRRDMINSGGEKIAPREIEEVLLGHPAVAQAAAFPVPHATMGESPEIAVVTSAGSDTLTSADLEDLELTLRRFLSRRLAHFKIPQRFHFPQALPATTSGKVLRRALSGAEPGSSQALSPGRTSHVRTRLSRIWEEVLECDSPSPEDNFFALGGHSLAAAQVINRIKEEFDLELPLVTLFEHPTLKSMTHAVEQNVVEPSRELSLSQQSIWFVDKRDGPDPVYNVSAALRLEGDLDYPRLQRALQHLVGRHQSLRSRVAMDGTGRPRLVETAQLECAVPRETVSHEELEQALQQELNMPFNLAEGPLFRCRLFQTQGRVAVLAFTLHHLICDGWSRDILQRELAQLYAGLQPDEACSGVDWADEEAQWLSSPQARCSRSYWMERLTDMRPLQLPFTSVAELPARPESFEFELSSEQWQHIRTLGEAQEATAFVVILAALSVVLSRYSIGGDVCVAAPVANRHSTRLESLVGQLANLVMIRTNLSDSRDLSSSVERTREAVLEALEHQRYPFEELLREVRPRRDSIGHPLVQVLLAYQNTPGSESYQWADGLTAYPLEQRTSGSKFDLTLYLKPHREGARGSWNFDSQRLDRQFVSELHENFLRVLGPEEAGKLPERPCVIQLFEEQVLRSPQQTALLQGDTRLTYEELDEIANRAASRLAKEGVGEGTLVGLCMPRIPAYVIAVMAIWKCGGAILALNPDIPSKRLEEIVSRVRPGLILVSGERSFQSDGTRCLEVMELLSEGPATWKPSFTPRRDSLAYLMFTSGSSGEPKGVRVSHANLAWYVPTLAQRLVVKAGDRYLHTAPFSFSSSMRQLLLPLCIGATLVLAGEEERRDPHKLVSTVERSGVTVMDLVPSHWRLCLEALKRSRPESLRLLLSASEPLPWTLATGMLECGSVEVVNMYGQTETSGIVCTHLVKSKECGLPGLVPLGRPLSGMRATLSQQGELVVEGPGVAPGYWPQEDFHGCFHSGDLARIEQDDILYFVGRLDDLIKVRGYRVHPAEVEQRLLEEPAVRQAAVFARDSRLHANLVLDPDVPEGFETTLRERLREQLPGYMIPSVFNRVGELPRTSSGKLSRSALPETSDTEQLLCDIWAETLDLPSVKPGDNFFDLGGDSITSVRMVELARLAGVRLSLGDIFKHQTVAELARALGPELHDEATDVVRLPVAQVRRAAQDFLVAAGLEAAGAQAVVEVQLESSLRGQPTHNLRDLRRYAARLKKGTLNGRPHIRVERQTAFSALIDGDNAPGQWVATVAMEKAIEKAKASGLGLVLARRSNHFGAAGHYPWLAVRQGLIGLCTTNGPLILAPTGGVTPTFGNNPIAVGIPNPDGTPVILDMALSVAPRGKIGLQLRQGRPLEEGWILDEHGRPSTDLADLAAGLAVPIGEHKGYGLALVMEMLAGVLSGAGFGWAHSREAAKSQASHADTGHLFLVIDPEVFQARALFQGRVAQLLEQVKGGRRAPGVDEILIPGELEMKAREHNLIAGVPLTPDTFRELSPFLESARGEKST